MSREIFGISTGFFGRDVKSLRDARGWSQRKLALELGCSEGAVRQWEKNRRHVNEFALQKMRELCKDDPALRGLFPQPAKSAVETPTQVVPEGVGMMRQAVKEESIHKLVQINSAVFQELEDRARNGDRGAAEALRAIAETWSRAAHLATNPDRAQRRKAQMNTDAIIHNRDS